MTTIEQLVWLGADRSQEDCIRTLLAGLLPIIGVANVEIADRPVEYGHFLQLTFDLPTDSATTPSPTHLSQ